MVEDLLLSGERSSIGAHRTRWGKKGGWHVLQPCAARLVACAGRVRTLCIRIADAIRDDDPTVSREPRNLRWPVLREHTLAFCGKEGGELLHREPAKRAELLQCDRIKAATQVDATEVCHPPDHTVGVAWAEARRYGSCDDRAELLPHALRRARLEHSHRITHTLADICRSQDVALGLDVQLGPEQFLPKGARYSQRGFAVGGAEERRG
eukprot:7379638-Prymnesium_polylepis.1